MELHCVRASTAASCQPGLRRRPLRSTLSDWIRRGWSQGYSYNTETKDLTGWDVEAGLAGLVRPSRKSDLFSLMSPSTK